MARDAVGLLAQKLDALSLRGTPMNAKPVTLAKAAELAGQFTDAGWAADLDAVPDWLTIVVDIAEILGSILPLLMLCGIMRPDQAQARAKAPTPADADLLRGAIRTVAAAKQDSVFVDRTLAGKLAAGIIAKAASSSPEDVAAVYAENQP